MCPQVFVKHLKKAAFCCGRATLQLQEYGDAIAYFEKAKVCTTWHALK